MGRNSTWSSLLEEARMRKVNRRARGLMRKKLGFTFSEEIKIGHNEERGKIA